MRRNIGDHISSPVTSEELKKIIDFYSDAGDYSIENFGTNIIKFKQFLQQVYDTSIKEELDVYFTYRVVLANRCIHVLLGIGISVAILIFLTMTISLYFL